MCMCGEHNPSYVCPRHAGTRHDWRKEHILELTRDEELDRAYGHHGTLIVSLKGNDKQ